MYETVEDLARRLDMLVEELIAELQSSGLHVSNVHDVVSESDQVKLQRYREGKRPSRGELCADGITRCPLCRTPVAGNAERCDSCFSDFAKLKPSQRSMSYWEKLEADDFSGKLSPEGSGDSPVSKSSAGKHGLKCPKCGASEVSANKRGFGLKGAAIGAAAVGPIGLLGGLVGANNVVVTCLHCGHAWNIG